MTRATGQILKSNDVKLEGQFHLDASKAGPDSPKQKIAASSAPQVRILENNPEYALLEVICCCGTKMSLKCEYAGAAAQAPDDPQT
jgi:hypothetical protein